MKAYTSLEQSQKLARILPLESADMFWLVLGNKPRVHVLTEPLSNYSHWENYPCWSLAALMAVIPHNVSFNKAVYRFKMVKYSEHWECYHENFGSVSTEIFKADNPVDACYEMIIKLHELNLL